MVVIKFIATILLAVVTFYAIIGAMFMHNTQYDHNLKPLNCEEKIQQLNTYDVVTQMGKVN